MKSAIAIRQHFVTFYSPGTFVSEETTKPIDVWDTDIAMKMARSITERYGAKPYGFRFTTRGRGEKDLDSKVTHRSPFFWLGGKTLTVAEIEARNDPKDEILLANMRSNKWPRVVQNDNSWRFTAPLEDGDVVLDFKP